MLYVALSLPFFFSYSPTTSIFLQILSLDPSLCSSVKFPRSTNMSSNRRWNLPSRPSRPSNDYCRPPDGYTFDGPKGYVDWSATNVDRPGYTNWDGTPTDHRGIPENYSGRVNRPRMDAHSQAVRHNLPPDDGPFYTVSPPLTVTSSTLRRNHDHKAYDDPVRRDPSMETERRSRGYNPSFYGVSASNDASSAPRLHDLEPHFSNKYGHHDEGYWRKYQELQNKSCRC